MTKVQRGKSAADSVNVHSAESPSDEIVLIQAFGACTVEIAGQRLGRNADVVATLILLLSHAPGTQIPRDTLLQLLWPASPEKHQRGNLRQALYKLRQMGVRAAMNGDMVELDATQLVPTFSVRRDGRSFDAQIVTGLEPFGPFLPAFEANHGSGLGDWVETERERAHGDARRVLGAALRARHAAADWVAAEPLARWMLQFDPLNEAATLVMAECLVISGAKYEAIRLLDRYMTELGPCAGDLRIPATTLRRRIAAPTPRRISFAPTERHFVGREAVMADLTLCMRRARFHDGSATLLHGTAGMGKTRVLHELNKVAVLEGVRDLRAGCRETDAGRPLSVFLELVPELLQLPGALGCAPESLHALRRFANDTSHAPSTPAPGAAFMMPLAAALRRSIVELIGVVAEEKPILLALEDVHWLDAASWEVIVDLVDRVGDIRVCLLMTSRLPHARPVAPERVPVALSINELPPLSPESSLKLAHAIGADLSAPIEESLGEWFVHTGEGVPLFLRSLVNHWIETGDAGGIPPTLLGVIGQRLQQLSPDALHVLQTVALLDRHAELGMIELVLQLPYFRVVSAIDDLHKAGAFDNDQDGVLVCHELIGRMAVDALGRNARRSLHKRIADVMQLQETSSGLAPVMCRDRLEHLLRAGDKRVFLVAAVEAIRKLLDAGYSYDALGVSESALEQAGSSEVRARVLSLQSEALYSCGEYAKLLSHPLSPASVGQGLSHLDQEDPEALLRWIDSAFHADTESDISELAAAATLIAETKRQSHTVRFQASTLAIRIAANACEDELAARAFQAGKDTALSGDGHRGRYDELKMLYHTSFGDHAVARDAAQNLLTASRTIASATERLFLRIRIAYCFRCCGLISETLELLLKIHSESVKEGLGSTFYFASWRLASLYLDMGELEHAQHWYVEFEKLAPIDREPLAAMLYHSLGLRIALVRKDLPSAQARFRKAQSSMPEQGHLIRHSASMANRLGIARLGEDNVEIEATIKSALPIYRQTCERLGQAFLASELALCMRKVGREEEGVELLTQYLTIHRREPRPLPHFLSSAAELLQISY